MGMNIKTLPLLLVAFAVSWSASLAAPRPLSAAGTFSMADADMLSRAGFAYDERLGWVDADGKPVDGATVARLRAQGGVQKLSLDAMDGGEIIQVKGGGFSGGGSRSYGGGSSRSYSSPSRSTSAPSRTYTAPSRTYTAPARTNTAPSRSNNSGSAAPRARSPITNSQGLSGTRTEHAKGGGYTDRFTKPDGTRQSVVTRVNPRTGVKTETIHETRPDGTRMVKSDKGTTTFHPGGGKTFTSKDGSYSRTVTRDTSMVNGQKTTIVHQTTVVNGRTVVVNRTYHHYTYGGYSYPVYVYPVYPFAPVYHPFFYNPWVAPMCYSFWTGYAPCYPSASYLIADMILLNAAANAQANADAAARAADQARLAQLQADDKAQIRAQVDQAMKEYEASHGNGTDATTLDKAMNLKTVFRVHEDMEATEIGDDGEESDDTCQLSEGDLLKLAEVPAAGDLSAKLKVTGSAGGDDHCELHQKISLPVANLQEMLNEFNRKVQTKMDAAKQAKDQGQLTQSGAGSSSFQ